MTRLIVRVALLMGVTFLVGCGKKSNPKHMIASGAIVTGRLWERPPGQLGVNGYFDPPINSRVDV
jgi:hypothetical protein